MAHEQWAERQKKALIELGVDPIEAQRSVEWVVAHVPEDEDPATWVPQGRELEVNLTAQGTIQDARTAWYISDAVPPKFKRLLDAKATDA